MEKLTLNEDLFMPFEFSELVDNGIIEEPSDIEIPSANIEIDVVKEETPSGPITGAETGIANQIIEMINGEWNTIADYNNLITMFTQYGFEEFIPVIEDINNEENLHVGQLQALLQKISPNAMSIQQGELEASSGQMNESVNARKFSLALVTNDYPIPRICDAILTDEASDTYTFETSLYKFKISKDKFNDCLRDGKSIYEKDCISFINKQELTENALPKHMFNYKQYSVTENSDGGYTIQKLSSYDEAEYVWAQSDKNEPDYFRFYLKGKEIPSPLYAEDENFSDIVDELIRLNTDIKPIPSYY